jgi:hypothetical protein
MNNNEVCTMTMNAKLLVGTLGLLAIAATPAAAAAKAHYVRTHHSHIIRVAPPTLGWEGAYGYAPRNVDILPRDRVADPAVGNPDRTYQNATTEPF